MSAFLHPGLLWGLLLAGVPIIIHLLNRRRYRTVRWAAQEFLRSAFKKNQKRLRIENLLLLIIRTAVIVLLVFALSRPFLAGGVAEALSGQTTHYTILLDNSGSMGLNEGVGTPLVRGVREAQKIVSTVDEEDSVTLYLTNDNASAAATGSARAVLTDSHDAEKVRSVLGRVAAAKATAGVARLSTALARVAEELPDRRPGQHVVIITDLQRFAWEGGAAGQPQDERAPAGVGEDLTGTVRTLRDLFEEIRRKGAGLHIIDVGPSAPDNAGVVAFAPLYERPLVERNEEVFLAKVANFGTAPLDVDVTFRVDDQVKGSVRVTVPEAPARGRAGEAIARFRYPSLSAGPRVFSAEIPTDRLPLDDVRTFAAGVRERIRILAVDGDPLGDLGAETLSLKNAIAPFPDRMEFTQIDYLSFLGRDVTGFDLVILANVQRVREDKVRELEEFVRRGGGLIVFLGDQVDPVLANRDLEKDGAGLLPAKLTPSPRVVPRDQASVRFDFEDLPSHPLLDGIFGPGEDPDGFLRALAPVVWGYWPVVPADDPSVSVLIRYTDAERSPAILERRFGEGRVLLFTTAADLEWSDLPRVIIVPLLHTSVYYVAHEETGRVNLAPFESYERELPARVEDVQITTPGGGRVKPAIIEQEDRKARIEFSDTAEPGGYRAEFKMRGAAAIDASTRTTVEAFAVNPDPREGDIRQLTSGELSSRYAGLDLDYGRTFAGRLEGQAQAPEGEIWKVLLYLVLTLLILEVLIARRFGDYARRTRGAEVAS